MTPLPRPSGLPPFINEAIAPENEIPSSSHAAASLPSVRSLSLPFSLRAFLRPVGTLTLPSPFGGCPYLHPARLSSACLSALRCAPAPPSM